jgi:hypothetical protein
MAHIKRMVLALVVLSMVRSPAAAVEWTVDRTDRGVVVKLNGQFVTEYLTKSGTKPILWPIIGPTGKPMTRKYPMEDQTGEETDHIHHRSFWFTHGSVNGIDFWTEEPGTGTIEHREFAEIMGGKSALIVSRNDWLGPDGQKQCADQRRIELSDDGDRRFIDFTIALTAEPKAVVFGDVKDGSFGLRVASSMRVEAKQGGQIITSAGDTNAAAFGKRAAWIDYHGSVDGQTVGIAILSHPANLGAPHYCFVRPFGLLAFNPFGEQVFTGSGDGTYTLPVNETLTLRYCVILHKGDEKAGRIVEAYQAYSEL